MNDAQDSLTGVRLRATAGALAGAALCAMMLACGGGEGLERETVPPPLVEAVPARHGALPIEEVMPGTVRARNQVAIRPEIGGRVVEVRAASGDSVRRGQALVLLDEEESLQRLRQAEADVDLAAAAADAARARARELETRVERTRALAREKLVSAQELESLEAELAARRAAAAEAEARVAQSRAAAEERRSALAKTVVKAPVSGLLGERRVEVGMQVDPGTLLFVIGDPDELTVEVELTEEMLSRVEPSQPVLIASRAAPDAPVRAALSRISPFLASDSFTTVAEIDVDNRERRLRPGMFVTVRILVGESREATLVPVSALWESPQSGARGVWVVDEAAGLAETAGAGDEAAQTARAVSFLPVEILAEGRGQVGVAGIDEGTWVITVGQHLLAGELARVRAATWERVQELQSLQDEDLLEGFLDKQQTLAAALGAEIPASEDVARRALEAAAAEPAGAGGAAADPGGR